MATPQSDAGSNATEGAKRVLVTGHKGFIGSAVFGYLKENGLDVDGCDLVDDLPEKRYDLIVHMAARTLIRNSKLHPYEYFLDGTYLTMRFLEKARLDSATFVYPTSGSIEEPSNPYSMSKRHGADWINLYRKLYGTNAYLLKFYNIYGETSRKGAVYLFCKAALEDGSVTVYGDGSHERDYTHVSDVAKLILRIAGGELMPGDYEVGTGIGTTTDALISKVDAVSGRKLMVKHEDYVLPEAKSLTAKGTVLVNPMSLDEGIGRVIDALKSEAKRRMTSTP